MEVEIKVQQSFCYEQLSFSKLFFFWGVDFLIWFSKCLALEVGLDTVERKMPIGVGCINNER
jgi:hypothetical protein